jgi:hypothetical protein
MNSTILDNILETSMVNGVEQNLKDALTDVGVNVPENACLWDVSNLIRKTLVSNTINGVNIKGAGAIKIVPTVDNDNITYTISVNVDTFRLKRPGYANNNEKFGNDLDVQDLFDDLFDNILPNVKGVHAGDITMTDNKGDDSTYWVNTYFESTGKKTGLIPNTKYLRLYLTSQDEPIYIVIGSVTSDITGGFNIKNSDTVTINIDTETKEITAHINIINEQDIQRLYNK